MESIVLIDYHGIIKYETIGELIHTFKLQVPKMGIQIGTYKRILLIMIESLENIMKHSEHPAKSSTIADEVPPSLSIVKNDNHFILCSSNYITRNSIPALKARIDFLNGLDQAGLKNFYKETITNGEFSKTGGAGLGLIEIVKISGKSIKYEFVQVDDELARYTQWITIDER